MASSSGTARSTYTGSEGPKLSTFLQIVLSILIVLSIISAPVSQKLSNALIGVTLIFIGITAIVIPEGWAELIDELMRRWFT